MDFDGRDDPFDDLFDEIERMMNTMAGTDAGGEAEFGADTHVDIHEREESLRLVADLQGVGKDDLELQCDGEVLTIRAAAADGREITERVRLPARVDERSAEATFNNGVLEVTFDRQGDSAAIDLE